MSVPLFCRDFGGAGEPPLVILHGMLGSSRNWQTAGADLARLRRVLALDMRNHGNSPHAPEMTYAALADDVIAWLDMREIPRAVLLGHSMGGKIAMLLACRHPSRVSSLIVVDIAPKDYFWPAHRDEFAAMNELNLGDLKSRTEAEMRMEGRIPNWGMRKFLTTNLERTADGHWRWQINLPALTSAFPDLERNPLLPTDRFAGPTLFLTGGKSRYVLPSDEPLIKSHFPTARVKILPDSGHNPHTEARRSFIAAVEADV